MAPEVREGDPATTRSDVWSLGVVLHEIFFGKRPERRIARGASPVFRGHRPNQRRRLIERAMLALCERCLADDPAERPEDAARRREVVREARRSPGAFLWSHAASQARRLGLRRYARVVAGRRRDGSYRRRSRPIVARPSSRFRGLCNAGEPADWTKVAKLVATVPGHVHCFSLVDDEDRPARSGAVPGRPRTSTSDSGARRPAAS